jgi:DNA-directed RNA polymerase subunit RPC12/RpoP
MATALSALAAFPCPLCLVPLRVRSSKKGKPYVVCDACGVQLFVRAKPGIARLASLMAQPEAVAVMQRLATVARQQRRTCSSCRHAFWLSEAELHTNWFNGAFAGYKCPSCGAVVQPDKPEKMR